MKHEISRREMIGRLGLAGGAATLAGRTSAQTKTARLPAGLPVFNVRDFGATADSDALNTAAFQSAIDTCSASGGGAVFFPPGRFLTGGLILRSRVTLLSSPGTVLLGSTRLEDYPVEHPALLSRTRQYVQHALVYGEDLDQVGIQGPGVFDGRGAEFRKQFGDDYLKRPYLVRLVNCRDVRIEDVTLTDSAMWTLHLLACTRVRVEGVRVWAHVASNNDGFDIDACEDVVVNDCLVDSDDDAIVLKSTLHRPCRNIAITNCVMASHCNAFKMGTESLGGFENVALSNCLIQSPPASSRINGVQRGISALALEMVDGGKVERIAISNLAIQGYEAALFLRLGDRGALLEEKDPKPAAGFYRGVSISHIVGDNIGKTGCAVAGIPGHPLRDISLDDISLRFEGGGTFEEAARLDVPERENGYPEATMFGVLPAYGIYARHVENLRLRNLDLGFVGSEVRPPFVFQDVDRLEAAGLLAQAGPRTECLFRLRSVRSAFVHGCRVHGPTPRIADMAADCRDIRWAANAFEAPGHAK
jgi:hypothetical protein